MRLGMSQHFSRRPGKFAGSALASLACSVIFLLPGCGGGGTQKAQNNAPSSGTMPQSRHVVMVLEENQSYASVVGNTSVCPNFNGLIQNGALATNYYADIHGSISDYFLLTTGQTLTNDDGSTKVWDVDNIARRMLSAGVSFKVYAEGIKQGYLGGDNGNYVIRHDPFAMLSDVANNPQVANAALMPFSQFGADVASGSLPEFSFIVPDVSDDAHNGSPQQADSWLQSNIVAPLMNDKTFQAGGDGVLIVVFDESAPSDVANGGGHVAAVFWGPVVKAGYTQQSTFLYEHESMLHTIMMLLNLPNPPGAAAAAPTMGEFFAH